MEHSPTTGLIICEQTGQWATALRRELGDAASPLHETRLLDEAWLALAEMPAAFVVAEFTQKNADDLLRRAVWLSRDFPQARLAIVAARRFAGQRWLLQASGAVHALFSPRDLGPLADIARRHMALVPSPPIPVAQRVWQSLPWSSNPRRSPVY
jgi:hypothetical protein